MTDDRCGYAVTDADGEQQPCDLPATGWRWYQDVGEHEDLLDVACDWHANEGGRRIGEALALADEWERAPFAQRYGRQLREVLGG